jgi:hypothetical protein
MYIFQIFRTAHQSTFKASLKLRLWPRTWPLRARLQAGTRVFFQDVGSGKAR